MKYSEIVKLFAAASLCSPGSEFLATRLFSWLGPASSLPLLSAQFLSGADQVGGSVGTLGAPLPSGTAGPASATITPEPLLPLCPPAQEPLAAPFPTQPSSRGPLPAD